MITIIDNPTDNKWQTFSITDTKLYVLVVNLSTLVNAKLLEQLKSGFKRTINWNKYEPNITAEQRNQYFDFLINPSFQGVNILFILSFENTMREQVARNIMWLQLDPNPESFSSQMNTQAFGQTGQFGQMAECSFNK